MVTRGVWSGLSWDSEMLLIRELSKPTLKAKALISKGSVTKN